MKSPKNTLNRRQFLEGVAAASAFTIIPRHVLGGPLFVAPSDKINIAQVGCGMQAQRQVNAGLMLREDIQITCVCDPNEDSLDYVDWSPNGTRDRIRRMLEDPTWGESNDGIRAGRACSREIIETYYGKTQPSGSYSGIRAYADYRELLEEESDIDAVVNITPDHQHAVIAIATLKKGKAIISHKPVSNILYEGRKAVQAARESAAPSHLLAYSNNPDRYTLDAWIKAGVIGTVREVHNWTQRPFWPQGHRDWFAEGPPVPPGFNWDLWLGPEPHRPYHPGYTSAVYRGWYAYGAGCMGDMGFYSLWQPYRILDLGIPLSIEAAPNFDVTVVDGVSRGRFISKVSYPKAGTLRFRHPANGDRPEVDVFWYEGGMRPVTPSELYDDNEDLPEEGMLFVGDDGKILCDYRGNKPRLLPKQRHEAFVGSIEPENIDTTDANDEWIDAVKNGTRSRGSFENVAPLNEAVCLGSIAYRVPHQLLFWDAEQMQFTNSSDANQYIRRDYRSGWEV